MDSFEITTFPVLAVMKTPNFFEPSVLTDIILTDITRTLAYPQTNKEQKHLYKVRTNL